jgi:hypothetical protein
MKCFLIKKGSRTYERLIELFKKMDGADKAALALAKRLGGKKIASANGRRLAGGFDGVQFDNKPEGWKIVGKPYQNLFMPKADQKAIWRQIGHLPVVEFDELNKIVGFQGNQVVSSDGGLVWVHTVGIHKGTNYFLMEVIKGTKYKPPTSDIVEILASEFEELHNQIGK